MRRETDKYVVVCVLLCILCTIVTVVVVAPTVLDTSAKTDETSTFTKDNCLRIHRMYETLDQMVFDGRQSLQAYRDDGTITDLQFARELARIETQRVKLAGADCPPRSVPPARTP